MSRQTLVGNGCDMGCRNLSISQRLCLIELIFIIDRGDLDLHVRRRSEQQGSVVIRNVVHLHIVGVQIKIDRTLARTSYVDGLLLPLLNLVFDILQLYGLQPLGASRGIDRYDDLIAGIAFELLALADGYLVPTVATQFGLLALLGIFRIIHRDVHYQTHLLFQLAFVGPLVGIGVSRHGNRIIRPVEIAARGHVRIGQRGLSIRARYHRSGVGHVAHVVSRTVRIVGVVELHIVATIDPHDDLGRRTAQGNRQLGIGTLHTVVEHHRRGALRLRRIYRLIVSHAVHQKGLRSILRRGESRKVYIFVGLHHGAKIGKAEAVAFELGRIGSAVGKQVDPILRILGEIAPLGRQCDDAAARHAAAHPLVARQRLGRIEDQHVEMADGDFRTLGHHAAHGQRLRREVENDAVALARRQHDEVAILVAGDERHRHATNNHAFICHIFHSSSILRHLGLFYDDRLGIGTSLPFGVTAMSVDLQQRTALGIP